MRKLALLALMSLGATCAQAADLSLKSPSFAPPLVASWSGFYLGADAGYGWGSVDDTVTVNGITATVSPKANGFIGGLYGGYNYQFNSFLVLGLETDIAWANIKRTADLTGKVDTVPFALQAEDKLQWLGTTRARVGFLPWQSIMLYGTAGVAYGGVQTSAVMCSGCSSLNSNLVESVTSSATNVGWAAGAGAEYAMTGNLLARVEWLHYDLGRTSSGFEQTSRHSGDLVRAGLGWKF